MLPTSILQLTDRKVGRLREPPEHPLGGRMLALLPVSSRLPQVLWYDVDAQAHDQRFWPQTLPAVTARTRLLFDLGFTNVAMFAALTQSQVTFVTRAKSSLSYSVASWLKRTSQVHDAVVWIGTGP